MPETAITAEQIKECIDGVVASNEEFAGTMNEEVETEFWYELDTRVKAFGGAGLPRP